MKKLDNRTHGIGYTTSDDKELQIDSPPNPPTSSSGPAAPLQDDGVLENPYNPNLGIIMDNLNGNARVLDSRQSSLELILTTKYPVGQQLVNYQRNPTLRTDIVIKPTGNMNNFNLDYLKIRNMQVHEK